MKVNWASGLDENGRPIQTPQPPGMPTWPGNQGGTNWYPPSFSPRTGLFYFSAWENYATIYRREEATYQPGRNFTGGGSGAEYAGPGRADRRHRPPRPDQQLDRRGRQRRGHGDGSADRQAEVEGRRSSTSPTAGC